MIMDRFGGFFGLLTLIFITLKLTAVLSWSWWWVLAPIWIPLLLTSVGVIVATAVVTRKNKQHEKDQEIMRDQKEQNILQGFEDDMRH